MHGEGQAQVLAYFDTGGVSNGGLASFAQASAKIATKPSPTAPNLLR
jgi:hypothetical protein